MKKIIILPFATLRLSLCIMSLIILSIGVFAQTQTDTPQIIEKTTIAAPPAGFHALGNKTGVGLISKDSAGVEKIFVYTDDSRLSDARPPSAHASSHTDGTDDIQSATNAQKGLATAAHITAIEANTAKVTESTSVSAPLILSTYGISIPQATTSIDGYITSTDWNTFNDKQPALGFTAVPDTRTINTYPLTGNITLSADDIGDGSTNAIITLAQESNFDTAYTHSQTTSGNPHSVTASELGLGNVDNTSDAAKNSATATLTNKTLTAPVINVTSDATGDIYYRNASGLFTRLAPGTNDQVLTLAGGIPSWATPKGTGTPVLTAISGEAFIYPKTGITNPFSNASNSANIGFDVDNYADTAALLSTSSNEPMQLPKFKIPVDTTSLKFRFVYAPETGNSWSSETVIWKMQYKKMTDNIAWSTVTSKDIGTDTAPASGSAPQLYEVTITLATLGLAVGDVVQSVIFVDSTSTWAHDVAFQLCEIEVVQ